MSEKAVEAVTYSVIVSSVIATKLTVKLIKTII